MNSTSRRISTRSVPESITGDVFAGQDSGDRYRSRLEMNRTTRFSDQGEQANPASDQHANHPAPPGATRRHRARVVPNLYRRIAHVLAFVALGSVGAGVA